MMIKEKLLECFKSSLPGIDSHLIMAPHYRIEEMKNAAPQRNAVKSSVLILFYQKSNADHLVFIRRPVYNGVHSGQIALPGGRWEATDKSLYHTALREAREEIGINSSDVSFCGKLSDLYIPPSNYIVSPYVGVHTSNVNFTPDTFEVAEIIEIPFAFFLDPKAVKNEIIHLANGFKVETPCFDYQGNIIWGATAMILSELIILWKTTVKYR
jgi:8-oxo-dGTP pyrophosphatase MutT (NUDIX family)